MDIPHILAAVIIGVLSVARTARLVAHDVFPPVSWFRAKWDDWTHTSDWNNLMHCQFCLTPYFAAGMALWFWLAGDHWTWWVINGVWGLSYVSAMIVSWDQPED